jgi:hypothetical protein
MRAAAGVVPILALIACGSDTGPVGPGDDSTAARIRFLGSTPAPGSSIVPDICAQGLCARGLTMTFEVSLDRALESPFLRVELLAGERCGSGYAFPGTALPPSQPVRLTASDFVLGGDEDQGCAYPDAVGSVSTSTVRASLIRSGTVVVRTDFPLQYTFAGPALSESATTPLVTELCWEIPGPSGGWCGDRPLPDDSTAYRCRVEDDDGDEVRVTLSFRSVDGCLTDKHCWTVSQSFGPRVVPLPVLLGATRVYPSTRGARVSCQAVDSRGRTSRSESVCFGVC